MVVNALKDEGHAVFDIKPPAKASPYLGLQLASQLLNADGCVTFRSFFRTGETDDPGAAQMNFYMKLPRFARYLHYLWVKYVRRDDIWAGLLRDFSPKTAAENWKLVSKREAFKETWKKWWSEQNMDVLLCVPNATPAVPHGGMKDAVSSCGYTFLFNLVCTPLLSPLLFERCTDVETARLYSRHHTRHPRRLSYGSTPSKFQLQEFEWRCKGRLQAL